MKNFKKILLVAVALFVNDSFGGNKANKVIGAIKKSAQNVIGMTNGQGQKLFGSGIKNNGTNIMRVGNFLPILHKESPQKINNFRRSYTPQLDVLSQQQRQIYTSTNNAISSVNSVDKAQYITNIFSLKRYFSNPRSISEITQEVQKSLGKIIGKITRTKYCNEVISGLEAENIIKDHACVNEKLLYDANIFLIDKMDATLEQIKNFFLEKFGDEHDKEIKEHIEQHFDIEKAIDLSNANTKKGKKFHDVFAADPKTVKISEMLFAESTSKVICVCNLKDNVDIYHIDMDALSNKKINISDLNSIDDCISKYKTNTTIIIMSIKNNKPVLKTIFPASSGTYTDLKKDEDLKKSGR